MTSSHRGALMALVLFALTPRFALDALLDAPLGSDRDAVLATMRGHVLAKGDLVGAFGQPAPPTAN